MGRGRAEGTAARHADGRSVAAGEGTFQHAYVDLAPGNYGLICFIPDAKDGKPHFMHGMATQFSVK